MKRDLTKISLFIVFISLFFSCNAVKRVPDGEYLLTENIILVDSVKIKNAGVYSQLAQKPNTSIPLIGIPLSLHIYNLADPQPDSTYYRWLHKNPKREERLISLLSKKQVEQIGNSYVGINEWLQKSGDAPAIVSEQKIEKSMVRLKRWYASYGYFNDEVDYKIEPSDKKKKRAKVTYLVKKRQPYFVGDSITEKISSPVVDSLYQRSKGRSFIVPGKQYAANDLVNERDRLTIQFRNSGLYHFEQEYVGFEADTVNTDHKANITYIIPNRKITQGDSTYTEPFKVHSIKEVRIVTDYSYDNRNKTFQDSISYNGYKLFSYGKMRFRPKAIADAISITPGKIYKDIDRKLTYNQISDLRIFKYPNINYSEIATDTTGSLLNATILLSPRDRFTLGVDFDAYTSTIQQFGISFSGNMIFRNIFRGAEILEISGRGSLGSSKDAADSESSFFNISEFGADVKLTFPRIIFPLNTEKLIPKYMSPSTSISLGASIQNNIGLDRQTINGIYNYRWKPSKILTYQIDLLNLQYVRNLNVENYYNVYKSSYIRLNEIAQNLGYDFNDSSTNPKLEIPGETEQFLFDVLQENIAADSDTFDEVLSIAEREVRLTENNLIFASNVTLTRDTRENINDNNFSRLRFKVESAGNVLSGISSLANLQKDNNGNYETLGVVYSQYIKTEAEYIKHWDVDSKNIIAVRAFGGIAIPYGNSNSIPFTRSYFAGGTNDNRGWRAYDLGPGSSGSVLDFNDANFKLAFNAEYRFTILGAFKGALFVDAGNIWNVLDDINRPSFTFDGIADLKEIAVASGVGLRYDFGFFVFRFDVGFKTHNPGKPVGERWFTDYNFREAVYNIGINYPF
ncbi:BamA/TamA family outer membrane protein [Aequorivita lipolytica]|uniref:Outer membrane protein assembly factor n=1 Tax=Aequorivita lipolytica TaxID=153267 RepID=A0A5C6YQW5_9FLAO|nr:BamA/TamA family outer membrane protein [Aequorivita lipolytica]TXD69747.1 outer membrane protein assembly factor [Aequorivita lipolytica]SRX50444.1 Outer membrane protein assembly factor BamA [Aequorivita lipolytica]